MCTSTIHNISYFLFPVSCIFISYVLSCFSIYNFQVGSGLISCYTIEHIVWIIRYHFTWNANINSWDMQLVTVNIVCMIYFKVLTQLSASNLSYIRCKIHCIWFMVDGKAQKVFFLSSQIFFLFDIWTWCFGQVIGIKWPLDC